MEKKLITIIFLTCFTYTINLYAQHTSSSFDHDEKTKPLLISQQLPEEFWNRKHLFYIDGDTVKKDLTEYRGKLLVLDFWATWCAICLAQMKGKQSLFAAHPTETGFLMVNSSATKDTFESIKAKQINMSNLSLHGKVTSIIEDDYIQQLFPTYAYPAYVWISPRGNLIAITNALSVSELHLKDLLDKLN